jgi:hypothetical protein
MPAISGHCQRLFDISSRELGEPVIPNWHAGVVLKKTDLSWRIRPRDAFSRGFSSTLLELTIERYLNLLFVLFHCLSKGVAVAGCEKFTGTGVLQSVAPDKAVTGTNNGVQCVEDIAQMQIEVRARNLFGRSDSSRLSFMGIAAKAQQSHPYKSIVLRRLGDPGRREFIRTCPGPHGQQACRGNASVF